MNIDPGLHRRSRWTSIGCWGALAFVPLLTACVNLGGNTRAALSKADVEEKFKQLVTTVNTAVALTCANLDERNAQLLASGRAGQQIDMQGATLTLSSGASRTKEGELSLLVVSGKASRQVDVGDALEIELARSRIPNAALPELKKQAAPGAVPGAAYARLPAERCTARDQSDAEHIACLTLSALQITGGLQPDLRLQGFSVTLDFGITDTGEGGLKLEFGNVGVGGAVSSQRKGAHQIKLAFGPPAGAAEQQKVSATLDAKETQP